MNGFNKTDFIQNNNQELSKKEIRDLKKKAREEAKKEEMIVRVCREKNKYEIYENLQKILNNSDLNIKKVIDKEDEYSKTALMYCVEKNDLESVRILLENGANPNILDGNKESAIFYILKNQNPDLDILDLLYKKNAHFSLANKFSETLLIKSLKLNLFIISKFLFKFNPDFYFKDEKGLNSLDLIFISQNQTLIDYLKNYYDKQKFFKLLCYYNKEKMSHLKSKLHIFEKPHNINQKFNNETLLEKSKKKKLRLNPKSSEFVLNLKNNKIAEKNEDKLEDDKKNNLKNNILKEKQEINELIKKIKNLEKQNQNLIKKIDSKKKKKDKNRSFERDEKYGSNKNQNNLLNYSILSNKINCYVNWVKKYQKDNFRFLKKIERTIHNLIKNEFSSSVSVETGGSFSINLFMPTSDLNLIVTFLPHHEKQKDTYDQKKIKKFADRLKKLEYIKTVKFEERSSIDIIKLEMIKENQCQKIEILFKRLSFKNYPSNDKIMRKFMEMYPISKPLYLIFRKILQSQKLDDPSKMGLRTLSIFLIVVGFLQNQNYPISSNGVIQPNELVHIGEIFVNFLSFYSYNFDFYKETIFPHLVDKKHPPILAKNFDKQIKTLTILNPYKSSIILTKSFKRTSELKSLFKLMYISLFQSCDCDQLFLKKKNNEIHSLNAENNFENNVAQEVKFLTVQNKNNLIKKNCEEDTTTPESPIFKFKKIIIKYSKKYEIKFDHFNLDFNLEHIDSSSTKNKHFFSEENLLSEKSLKISYQSPLVLQKLFNFNINKPLLYN
jgi:DNA polymerase sigma